MGDLAVVLVLAVLTLMMIMSCIWDGGNAFGVWGKGFFYRRGDTPNGVFWGGLL